MKKTIINPQWQGGGSRETYDGALELCEIYLTAQDYDLIPVSLERDDARLKYNDITAFTIIRDQMQALSQSIKADRGDTIFSIGGGCDADIPFISYFNEMLGGDLAILYLDAHGDINSPSESSSSLFYGMPLRALMDKDCYGLMNNPTPITPNQIIHVGGREFDETEVQFIEENSITAISVSDCHESEDVVLEAIRAKGFNNVYVHLDLDVLDSDLFPYAPLPVPNGLTPDEVLKILDGVSSQSDSKTVGFGLYEYRPIGRRIELIEKLIEFGLSI